MKKQVQELSKRCELVAGKLAVLSHPKRLVILCALSDGEMSAGELEEICGASQSAVSQFLKEMRLEGVLASRREGRFVYFSIADDRMRELIKSLHKIFCG
ncbi:MAG: helix-turn-helix transcriptional regulator [Calothrix sp. SM1_5_4]|nr:helix-turn-helix transcriptional regulator [Calothrix sp. SM1_5_4]